MVCLVQGYHSEFYWIIIILIAVHRTAVELKNYDACCESHHNCTYFRATKSSSASINKLHCEIIVFCSILFVDFFIAAFLQFKIRKRFNVNPDYVNANCNKAENILCYVYCINWNGKAVLISFHLKLNFMSRSEYWIPSKKSHNGIKELLYFLWMASFVNIISV